MDFAIGGLAAVGATIFTNPLEVVKTRMQLQGELNARGQYTVQYKNFVHAGYIIAKHDGVLALQAGLVPGLWFQLFLNGFRLGAYDLIVGQGLIKDEEGKLIFYKSVIASGLTGIGGCLIGSPFYLVKTHLQAQAAQEIAFGHQHHHKGMTMAFKNIYKEYGVKGLFRGSTSAIPRAFVGSIAQLTTFDYAKQWLQKYQIFPNFPLVQSFIASMTGGVMLSLMMTPFDLITTRMYNQGVDSSGKGLLYRSYMDCVLKVWRSEGFLGFYKGLGASYIRLGPHTVLCLVFWDELKAAYSKLGVNS